MLIGDLGMSVIETRRLILLGVDVLLRIIFGEEVISKLKRSLSGFSGFTVPALGLEGSNSICSWLLGVYGVRKGA